MKSNYFLFCFFSSKENTLQGIYRADIYAVFNFSYTVATQHSLIKIQLKTSQKYVKPKAIK